MQRWIAGLVLLIGVGGFAAWLGADRFVERVMQARAEAALRGDALARMDDGLHVVLCGSGSPLPDPTRAGPCVLVVAGEQVLMVDVGSGSMRNLGLMGVPPGAVDALLLTHFHSDHIDGIGELMLQRWAGGGRTSPLPIHGPEGVSPIVAGFNQAYAQDFGYRIAHHGSDVIPPEGAGAIAQPFAMPGPEGHVLFEREGLKVTVFEVDHAPVAPSVGYRFDYRGRSAVISGDTVPTDSVRAFATGVDLLVHEALASELVNILTRAAEAVGNARVATITRDILDYHTSPVQAAEIAQAAGARHLLYYHIVPQLPVWLLERRFVAGVDDVYDGPVTVGRDGTWIAMPSSSPEITVRYLLD